MTFKLILTDSIYFFKRNIRQIATLCLPFLLAGALINHFFFSARGGEPPDSNAVYLFSMAVNLALYPIYTAALIHLMARQARNELPANTELVAAALQQYAPFLLLSLMAMALVWMGFLLFIIPGIWVAVRLSFAEFFLVLEGTDPRTAMVKSFHATRRYFTPILAALALFALPVFILGLFISNAMAAIEANAVVEIAADTTISFLTLFMDVVLFRIFMEAQQSSGPDTIRPQM